MGDFGFKMVMPEKKITSTDPRDYIVWSKYPPLKITKYGKGSITVALNAASADTDIVHGLTYPPAYLAYFENNNDGRLWFNGSKLGQLSTFTVGEEQGKVSLVDNYKTRFSYTRTTALDSIAREVPFRYILFDESTFNPPTGDGKPIGYQTVDNGIKVSNGTDVFKAKLYEQYLNSNTDYLKYQSTTTGSFTFNNTSNGEMHKEFAHGFTYPCAFLVYGYFSSDNGEHLFPVGVVPQPFASGAFVDTNRIMVQIIWAAALGTPVDVTFFYRLVIFKNNLLSVL